ncbi:hypothetical protein JCM16303_005767 [Sporobolomyces ruberrimus]
MGKKTRNSKAGRYASKLSSDKLQKVARSKTGTGKMSGIPIATAIMSVILAFGVGWVQGQSKDLLPKYMMGPAIIGAVFAGLTAILAVFGCVKLNKADGYHDKEETKHRATNSKRPLDPETLKHQSHPFFMYHWILLGDGAAMLVTTGSYLYMLLCLVWSGEACVAITPATSEDDCKVKGNNGSITVLLLLVLTIATGVLLFYYRDVVKDSLDYFDYRHQRLQKLASDPSGRGQRRGQNRQTSQRDLDDTDDQVGDDMYSREKAGSYGDEDDFDGPSGSDFGDDDYGNQSGRIRPPPY